MGALLREIERRIDTGEITDAPTIKAFASVMNINPIRLYTVAKIPKAGEVYDANKFNWDALEEYMTLRLDEAAGYATINELLDLAIEAEKDMAKTDKRRQKRTPEPIVMSDGRKMPVRKVHVFLGDIVYTKDFALPYEVVYLTDTHVCLQVVDSSELRAMSNWTYNQKIKERVV